MAVSRGRRCWLAVICRWLEQRRIKKREQDNIEFSKKVVKDWKYNRDGALAKKVCYEGMLPYTRIMVAVSGVADG